MLRRCHDAGRKPDPNKDGAWLKAQGDAWLAELHREMPAATDEIREREGKQFLADLQLFLDAECEGTDRTPLGFEVTFGRPLGEDEDPLASPEPLEVDLGRGLKFRVAGRIDRIDNIGRSTFEVIDYKTGICWRDSYVGTFRGGRLLQHAIYGLAAVQLLKARKCKDPKVVAGTYYFPSQKGRRHREVKPSPPLADIAAVLAELRAVIVNGTFVHPQKKDDCKFCDFEYACLPATVRAQAEGKAADAKLEAYRRLNAHA